MSGRSAGVVVDTSVARAAGAAEHPTSRRCREFLEAVHRAGLELVLSDDLWAEWRAHHSSWTRKWLVSMYARRRVRHLGDRTNPPLRDALAQCARARADTPETADAWAAAVLKDALLVEAATTAAGAPIASTDEQVRGHFRACCASVAALRGLRWVNPTFAEDAIAWVEAGLPDEPDHALC